MVEANTVISPVFHHPVRLTYHSSKLPKIQHELSRLIGADACRFKYPSKAETLYRELIRAHPSHRFSQIAISKLVLLLLYDLAKRLYTVCAFAVGAWSSGSISGSGNVMRTPTPRHPCRTDCSCSILRIPNIGESFHSSSTPRPEPKIRHPGGYISRPSSMREAGGGQFTPA